MVIEKCGGHQKVAAALGVDVSRVHRWTYPRERGGTGGVVPSRHQQRLLDWAKGQGIELSPGDFFALEPAAPPAGDRSAAA